LQKRHIQPERYVQFALKWFKNKDLEYCTKYFGGYTGGNRNNDVGS
jgi:hypothetical protein